MVASNKISSVQTRSVGRLAPFGPAPLLAGEDAAAYDQLLACVSAAVKPVDIIDEIHVADVVPLEWEVLRWRRLKSVLIQARALGELEGFLREKLEYHLYWRYFRDRLAEILEDNLPEDEPKNARTLACECAWDEPDAKDKVDKVLAGMDWNVDAIMSVARARKAKELVQEYVCRKPRAVKLVDKILSAENMNMDVFVARALVDKLDDVERIDRLTAIAEGRRNASLREIDRRRVVLGEALRRSVQEIEDGEFKVIETTQAKGIGAA